jgi:hypothetical protein
MEEQGAACPLFHPLAYIAPRSAGQLSEEMYVNARLDAFCDSKEVFQIMKVISPLNGFLLILACVVSAKYLLFPVLDILKVPARYESEVFFVVITTLSGVGYYRYVSQSVFNGAILRCAFSIMLSVVTFVFAVFVAAMMNITLFSGSSL